VSRRRIGVLFDLSTSPTMISGIPRASSMTLFLTQSAAFSLDASASSAVSNMLMAMIASGPPSSRYYHRKPASPRVIGTKPSRTRLAHSAVQPRRTRYFLMAINIRSTLSASPFGAVYHSRWENVRRFATSMSAPIRGPSYFNAYGGPSPAGKLRVVRKSGLPFARAIAAA
jgi:hypothetical protein